MTTGPREIFVGFDSAWTDNPKKPGAITLCEFRGGHIRRFMEPQLATFDDALTLINRETAGIEYVLIALDQPTYVPNLTGCRPVERVAGSVVNAIKGGVQPANRSRVGMFCDDAPIWRFLNELQAVQNPEAARDGRPGRHLIEVFPALAMPALMPETWLRRRAAKYNPSNRKQFAPTDWTAVTRSLADQARALCMPELAGWCEGVAQMTPRKLDQDKLDAAICLVIAVLWRRAHRSELAVIGDPQHGYMVTPVSTDTARVLRASAQRHGVDYDADWLNVA